MKQFKEYLIMIQEQNESQPSLPFEDPKQLMLPFPNSATLEPKSENQMELNKKVAIGMKKKLVKEVKDKSKENTIAFRLLKKIENSSSGMSWGQIQDYLFELVPNRRRSEEPGKRVPTKFSRPWMKEENKFIVKKPETWGTNLLHYLIPLYMHKVGKNWMISEAKLKFLGLNSIDDLKTSGAIFRKTPFTESGYQRKEYPLNK